MRELADEIIEAQRREIEEMKRLIGDLTGNWRAPDRAPPQLEAQDLQPGSPPGG